MMRISKLSVLSVLCMAFVTLLSAIQVDAEEVTENWTVTLELFGYPEEGAPWDSLNERSFRFNAFNGFNGFNVASKRNPFNREFPAYL